MDIKREIPSNTIIIGYFDTQLTSMDKSRQKINNEIMALMSHLEEIDLMEIYRTSHPKTSEYIFFSSAHGTFSRIDHILCHKQASIN